VHQPASTYKSLKKTLKGTKHSTKPPKNRGDYYNYHNSNHYNYQNVVQ
jgi:hypothetical protein